MGFAKENQMGFSTWRKSALAVVLAALLYALIPAGAMAKTADIIAPSPVPPQGEPTADNGWQAGTCKVDAPVCSVDTPDQFFEEAAAHPQVGFTQFIVRSEEPFSKPVGDIAKIHVDLPVGLSVNPQATPQCPLATFQAGASGCDALGSQVGESLVTVSVPLLGPVGPMAGVTQVPVYNVVPENGQPALFGLELAGQEVFLKASVDWAGDFHEGFTIDIPEIPLAGPLLGGIVLKNRLTFNGRSGDGTFITTPSTCWDPEQPPHEHAYSTWLQAASREELASPGYHFPASAEPRLESPLPKEKMPIDCPGVPYDPSVEVEPGTDVTDSPAGAATTVEVPHLTGGGNRDSSNTKEARVGLPAGLGLNPSAANGLVTCSDDQFGKGTRNPVACPPESKIGTVELETPPLPAGSLDGDVFVGSQQSRDPSSGNEFRIFVDAESQRYGISVRLIGNVAADPATGNLTARFGGLPQVPFSAITIDLEDGDGAVLTSPTTCGPHKAGSALSPWTEGPDAGPESEVTLTSAPAGGACAQRGAERPFAPSFAAAGSTAQAAAYTNLSVDLGRVDGEQELKGAEVTLPPGLVAKLAGLRYCPESTLAGAAARSGAEEAAAASCPPESFVGSASIVAGSGGRPIHIDGGKAFLAGPYNGAPLSLAVVTPATAGPFDLGTVVVRVALFLDPRTAQVRAVTDPIPHVYGGVTLDIRSVSLKLDRPEFGVNPTNCSASSFAAILRGGGDDPGNPAGFTSFAANSPFQAAGCEALDFKPKLYLRTFGGTKRTKNPKLRAIVIARSGDANIGRAQVTLPKSIILDQAALSQICTRVKYAAHQCPQNSIYGFAEATSPLLDGPLKGPVYLRSSDNTLPDLVASLHGQVDIELDGRTDSSKRGRIRNTFDLVPDVPISEFVLTIRGGKKRGLLQNSRNLCKRKQFARVEFNGQNGKRVLKKKQRIKTPCKKHKKRHRKGHKKGSSKHRK
jgi:hypothetical protein